MSLLNTYTESYNIWIIYGKSEQLGEDKQRWFLPSPNSNFEEVITASAGEVISRVTQSRQRKFWNHDSTLTTKWRGFYWSSILLLKCSSKHAWLANCSEQISHTREEQNPTTHTCLWTICSTHHAFMDSLIPQIFPDHLPRCQTLNRAGERQQQAKQTESLPSRDYILTRTHLQ